LSAYKKMCKLPADLTPIHFGLGHFSQNDFCSHSY
jgi:hypothetical protein